MRSSHIVKKAPATEPGFWTPGRILALTVIAALVVRVLATLTRQMIQADEIAYVRLAENLAAGNGYRDITGLTAPIYSPSLPLLIAGLAFVVKNYVLAGYVVVTVFGSLMLIPLYLLARDLFNERVGLMAAALMAVMPFFVGTSEYIYTEVIYIFFLLTGLFCGWRMLKGGGIVWGAAAGASLGLAYLSNPSAPFYLLAVLMLAAAVAFFRGVYRKPAWAAGAMVLAFLVFAAPYMLFLHAELGRWTFTGKNMAGPLYSATHDARREDIRASEQGLLSLTGENGEPLALSLERQNTTPFSFVLGQPKAAAKNFIKQTLALHDGVLARILPLWLLPLLGLGLFGRKWDRTRAAACGYLLLMISPVLLVLVIYTHARFFMPYVPFAVILVACGWQRLEEWGRQTAELSFSGEGSKRLARLMPWLIGAAVLLPLLVYSAAMVKQQSFQTQHKAAGQWLKSQVAEGARIMNRDFSSAYYAGGTAVLLPYADYQAMTDYAVSQDVDYLIVGRKALQEYRPEQDVLLEDDARHPQWKLIHVEQPGLSGETLIFELTK